MTRGNLTQHIKLILKLLIAALLLFALYRLGAIDFSLISVAFVSPALLSASLLCLFAGIVLGGVRWWMLLRISGHNFRFLPCLKLQLFGSFFNIYLPGAAGGDLIRGAYIYRMIGKDKGRYGALFSIFVDRLFALLGLILSGIVIISYMILTETSTQGVEQYIRLTLILLVLMPVGIAVGFLAVHLVSRLRIFKAMPVRIQHTVHVAINMVKSYAKEWPTMLFCALLSLISSGTVIMGIVFISMSFPFSTSIQITAIAGVFGNIFSAIPITPGGIGVGESIFASICRKLSGNMDAFATIYLAFRIQMFIVNIPGGIWVIYDRIARNLEP